jgi:hypothetical protein
MEVLYSIVQQYLLAAGCTNCRLIVTLIVDIYCIQEIQQPKKKNRGKSGGKGKIPRTGFSK